MVLGGIIGTILAMKCCCCFQCPCGQYTDNQGNTHDNCWPFYTTVDGVHMHKENYCCFFYHKDKDLKLNTYGFPCCSQLTTQDRGADNYCKCIPLCSQCLWDRDCFPEYCCTPLCYWNCYEPSGSRANLLDQVAAARCCTGSVMICLGPCCCGELAKHESHPSAKYCGNLWCLCGGFGCSKSYYIIPMVGVVGRGTNMKMCTPCTCHTGTNGCVPCCCSWIKTRDINNNERVTTCHGMLSGEWRRVPLMAPPPQTMEPSSNQV